jgi:hypothetical protein
LEVVANIHTEQPGFGCLTIFLNHRSNTSNMPSSLSRTPDMQLPIFPLPKGQKDVDGLSKEIDILLSKELKSLSIQQRTKVQEEVHGVVSLCPEENPAMIAAALKSMQQYLDTIHDKHVYDQLSPDSYLHTKEWRLKFLRCELYDCKMAAERLVRFTEYMQQEYDLEVLERPLRLSDLETKCGARGKEVMNSFKSGHTQLLPFRDRSGRRVMASLLRRRSLDAAIKVGPVVWVWFCSSLLANESTFMFCCISVSVQDFSVSLACCI